MKQEDMKEKPEEKSTNENVCVVLNDTITGKKDEISFLNEVKELFKGQVDLSKEIDGLVRDSKNYISTVDIIKSKTKCCSGSLNETR